MDLHGYPLVIHQEGAVWFDICNDRPRLETASCFTSSTKICKSLTTRKFVVQTTCAANELLNPIIPLEDASVSFQEGDIVGGLTNTALAALPVAGAVALRPILKQAPNAAKLLSDNASRAVQDTLTGFSMGASAKASNMAIMVPGASLCIILATCSGSKPSSFITFC